jgi:hypothetical protein
MEFANEEFTNKSEKKKIMANEQFVEIALTDLKRVKRCASMKPILRGSRGVHPFHGIVCRFFSFPGIEHFDLWKISGLFRRIDSQ